MQRLIGNRQITTMEIYARLSDEAFMSAVCQAIYTRKSTDTGLDSEFSSIDNQREACEAFIRSQREEGWVLNEERFDDGGFSGGTIERPALRRLLLLVKAGEIDCVVVYKIDRLSRSLLDFVRLLELFESKKIAFVAVTQQINTTTSAGRLMLNVLISFAQFERELCSERTREKIHAARKKGRYTGGTPPLGYSINPITHQLEVAPEEATMIRELFELYLEHRSLLAVVKVVNARGWVRKSWLTARQELRGGKALNKVYLQRLLTNPLYLGKAFLKGDLYPGLHEAIVDEETFNQVGALLVANRNYADPSRRCHGNALLRGLVRCGRCGAVMAHTWTRKGGRRYSYLGCNTAQKQGRSACPTPTLPAGDVEAAVINEIKRLAQDPALIDQVFAEALEQAKQNRELLEMDRTRLLRQREQREEAIKRLVSSLESPEGQSPAVIGQRIGERQAEIAQLNLRLQDVEQELNTLTSQTLDRDHLAQTLAQFTDLWDVLYPIEQVKLVRSVIETVVYHDEAERFEIRFRFTGDTREVTPARAE